MSDTPRTDAAVAVFMDTPARDHPYERLGDFARTLERELAAATALYADAAERAGEHRVVLRPDPDGARYRMLVMKRQGWFSRFAPCDVLREGIGMKGALDRALDKLIEEEPLKSEPSPRRRRRPSSGSETA